MRHEAICSGFRRCLSTDDLAAAIRGILKQNLPKVKGSKGQVYERATEVD